MTYCGSEYRHNSKNSSDLWWEKDKFWAAVNHFHTLCLLLFSPHQGLPIPVYTSLVDLKIKEINLKEVEELRPIRRGWVGAFCERNLKKVGELRSTRKGWVGAVEAT